MTRTRGAPGPRADDGPRFALGTLTVLPVTVHRWDRAAARAGMLWAPGAGLLVGLLGAAVGGVPLLLGSGAALAAVATVAAGAVLTRGLHLDGLADVADGLGSGKPPEGALAVMKRSDIGPFGVLTLVLVLLAQVAALAQLYAQSWATGAFAAVLAAAVARTALTAAARVGVPAARPEGLGAAVAETVPVRGAVGMAAGVAWCLVAAGWALFGLSALLPCALAVLLGLGCAEALLRHCRRRFGGVNGDVFGAVCEVAGTAALLVLTFG